MFLITAWLPESHPQVSLHCLLQIIFSYYYKIKILSTSYARWSHSPHMFPWQLLCCQTPHRMPVTSQVQVMLQPWLSPPVPPQGQAPEVYTTVSVSQALRNHVVVFFSSYIQPHSNALSFNTQLFFPCRIPQCSAPGTIHIGLYAEKGKYSRLESAIVGKGCL